TASTHVPYAGEVFPSVTVLAPTRKIWCRLSGCQNVFLNNCRWVSVVDESDFTICICNGQCVFKK
ncbi:TPA: hypothetical protein ACP4QB_003811, partial [Escherichia coli]